jgi:RNA polymerase sigma-70 factor (ECF subfamily)
VTGESAPADAALAERAASGDHAAFAELVRRHKEPLYRLLRRYAGNSDDAYEAAQEAFIAAWSAMSRYDPQRPFLTWLRVIAINKVRDRHRRNSFRRMLFGTGRGLEDEAVLAEPDPALPADEQVMEQQDMTTLDRAIAKLPAPLKEALLLTAFDGLTQQEAGQILGVSIKTIETRVHRARKILARTLDPALRPKA